MTLNLRGGSRRTDGALPLALILLIGIAAIAAACGATTPSASAPAASGDGSPLASATASGPADGSSAPGPSDDSAARLAAALTTLAKGYTFDTTVTVNDVAATHTAGRWISGTSEFVVTTSGTSITYRALPPKAWVQRPDGTWVEVAAAQAAGNPLAGLAKPTTLTAIASGLTGAIQAQATYPASALGLTGKAAVAVTLTIADDGSLTADFSTGAAPTVATSKVILQPSPDQQPLTAPAS